MVPAAQRSSTALITGRTLSRTALASALVAVAAPHLAALGVAQIFPVARRHLAVFPAATLLLHLLSAGVAVAAVTPPGAGVFPTGQGSIAGVSAGQDVLGAARGALGFSTGAGPVSSAWTGRTGGAVAHLLTGVVPAGESPPTHLCAVPAWLGARPLSPRSPAHTALLAHSGTGPAL